MEVHWYEYASSRGYRTAVHDQVTCRQCLRLLEHLGTGPGVRVTCDRTLQVIEPPEEDPRDAAAPTFTPEMLEVFLKAFPTQARKRQEDDPKQNKGF